MELEYLLLSGCAMLLVLVATGWYNSNKEKQKIVQDHSLEERKELKEGFEKIEGLMTSYQKIIIELSSKIDIIANNQKDYATTEYVQVNIANLTRELVGMKKKIIPTFNIIKTYFAKHGIVINTNGEYLDDLSYLFKKTPDEFADGINKHLKEDKIL